MLLLVLYIANVFQFTSSEWIEISQTLLQPEIESVTIPKIIVDQIPTSTYPEFTTFATTEPKRTEIYANQTLNSLFLKQMDVPALEREEQENFRFVDYIEDVQNKLLEHNHKSPRNKIEILMDLKNTLLYNIKEKITNLWSPAPQRRETRELHEKEDDSHMDFPSNEGALMTIGFLTFAVFLIKLVLKLITALKEHKNNGMASTTMAPATVLFGRKRRDVNEDELRILKLIDEFKLK